MSFFYSQLHRGNYKANMNGVFITNLKDKKQDQKYLCILRKAASLKKKKREKPCTPPTFLMRAREISVSYLKDVSSFCLRQTPSSV